MLHIETNKKSNILNLKFFSNMDISGNYNLILKKSLVNNFVTQMINKNWDMESKIVKEYTNNNYLFNIDLPEGTLNTKQRVFINKNKDIVLNNNYGISVIEYNEKERKHIDFPCKKEYHSEKVSNVFYFNNPNKKIIVKVTDENKIEIDVVLDHEKDTILRLVNELITNSCFNTF
jgi:hypothetical protein